MNSEEDTDKKQVKSLKSQCKPNFVNYKNLKRAIQNQIALFIKSFLPTILMDFRQGIFTFDQKSRFIPITDFTSSRVLRADSRAFSAP